MRYTNLLFTYLLTYLLTYSSTWRIKNSPVYFTTLSTSGSGSTIRWRCNNGGGFFGKVFAVDHASDNAFIPSLVDSQSVTRRSRRRRVRAINIRRAATTATI